MTFANDICISKRETCYNNKPQTVAVGQGAASIARRGNRAERFIIIVVYCHWVQWYTGSWVVPGSACRVLLFTLRICTKEAAQESGDCCVICSLM